MACVCPLAAADECSCTGAEAGRNLTAEEAKLEQTLSARAKALSAWWAAQNATTRLTRVWSGPVADESTAPELPSMEQTTDLWWGGCARGGHGHDRWTSGGRVRDLARRSRWRSASKLLPPEPQCARGGRAWSHRNHWPAHVCPLVGARVSSLSLRARSAGALERGGAQRIQVTSARRTWSSVSCRGKKK